MEITHNIGTQAFYDFNVRHNVLRKEVSLLLCNTIYPPPHFNVPDLWHFFRPTLILMAAAKDGTLTKLHLYSAYRLTWDDVWCLYRETEPVDEDATITSLPMYWKTKINYMTT